MEDQTVDLLKILCRKVLIYDEGFREYPYEDTMRNITFGIGRRRVSYKEAIDMCDSDIMWFIEQLNSKLSFFDKLNNARKMVIVNMCFNIGLAGFMHFESMLAAIERNDFDTAANEMMRSKWATQVPARAERLSKIMREGVCDAGLYADS